MMEEDQSMVARRFLADLRQEIAEHSGVGHSLLGRMVTDPRTKHDFKVLASQHYPLVANFTSYMELLLLRAPHSRAKCWIAKVLIDEYGERSDGLDHSEIYQKFMQACGIEAGEEARFPLHPEVQAFIQEHYRICTEEPFLVGLGAIGPGHEWAIPAMFTLVLKGLEKAGFKTEEIEYWSCHLEQDQDHGAWLEEALVEYCNTEEARQQVRHGALLSLNARERFWWGVFDKINTELTRTALPQAAFSSLTSEDKQITFDQLRQKFKIAVNFNASEQPHGSEKLAHTSS